MNIFVTDESPVKSAQVLPDKHIVKMPSRVLSDALYRCLRQMGARVWNSP